MENHKNNSSFAAAAINAAVLTQEAAIDDALQQYDNLLDDEEALSILRQKRINEMKQNHIQKQKYIQNGHGQYIELGQGQDTRDVAKEFFDATKHSERLIVHFYRPSTEYSDIFHKHLSILASKHLETRFIKINVQDCDTVGEKGATFLVERLNITVLPTLLLVKNRKAFHQMKGFTELGNITDFTTAHLAHVLNAHGVLQLHDDEEEGEIINNTKSPRGVNSIRFNNSNGITKQHNNTRDYEDY